MREESNEKTLDDMLFKEDTYIIGQRDVVGAVVSTIYKMAPRHQPRKISLIIDKLITAFHKFKSDDANDPKYKRVSLSEMNNWLTDTLMSISEFKELNLSQDQYEQGITDNTKTMVIDRYTDLDKIWRSDFIDLDACIRNICDALYFEVVNNLDCFMCKHDVDWIQDDIEIPEICKNCGRFDMRAAYPDRFESNL